MNLVMLNFIDLNYCGDGHQQTIERFLIEKKNLNKTILSELENIVARVKTLDDWMYGDIYDRVEEYLTEKGITYHNYATEVIIV